VDRARVELAPAMRGSASAAVLRYTTGPNGETL